MKPLVALLMGTVLVWLAGCGFHLRGRADLPPELALTHIAYNQRDNPKSPLVWSLKRALEANGVEVTDSLELSTAQVRIINELQRRRVLATDAQGDAREYELSYEVSYGVILAGGERLVPVETLRVSRNLFYAESEVLGRAEGEELMVNDMADDLAWSIIRRMQSAGAGR